MRIVVCVKQVPDIGEAKRIETNRKTGTVIREGVPAIVNPFDEYALEEAVRLKERHGGEIVAISMGPAEAEEALIKSLSMGCDQAVLLTDSKFAGSDTVATSYTLAAAIRKIGEFDLILCGQKAIDGETAQVGPMLAENLHVPQITYVNELEIQGKKVIARRELEKGFLVVQCRMPVVLTLVKGINVPRVPTYSDLSDAMEKEIITWAAEDLDVEESLLGLRGSPTSVSQVWTPELRPGGEALTGEPSELANRIAEVLLGILEG
jgi:electron transfer flavoprotein beta subunit